MIEFKSTTAIDVPKSRHRIVPVHVTWTEDHDGDLNFEAEPVAAADGGAVRFMLMQDTRWAEPVWHVQVLGYGVSAGYGGRKRLGNSVKTKAQALEYATLLVLDYLQRGQAALD